MTGCISAKKLEATINQFGLTIDIKASSCHDSLSLHLTPSLVASVIACVWQKLIEEADTDGSGEIEYDEFKQMFDT